MRTLRDKATRNKSSWRTFQADKRANHLNQISREIVSRKRSFVQTPSSVKTRDERNLQSQLLVTHLLNSCFKDPAIILGLPFLENKLKCLIMLSKHKLWQVKCNLRGPRFHPKFVFLAKRFCFKAGNHTKVKMIRTLRNKTVSNEPFKFSCQNRIAVLGPKKFLIHQNLKLKQFHFWKGVSWLCCKSN